MTRNHVSYKIKSATSKLQSVRGYLDTGRAINWVCDEIRYSLEALMEAWLFAKGYEKIPYPRLKSFFLDRASEDLRSKMSYCLSTVSFLDFHLMGGEEYVETKISILEWKQKAYTCLEQAEKVMDMIKNEIAENSDSEKM